MYTRVVNEVALGKALVDLEMSRGATVAWLMGQPYDVPKSLSAPRIFGWRIMVTYGVLAYGFAVSSGRIYGLLVGGL